MDEIELEEYRRENPMDYIKAIDLINQNPYDFNVGMTIYKITRLHIPNTVRKYYSLTDNEELNNLKLKTLEDGKIYMATTKEFNDPFDGKSCYYDNDKLKKYERLKRHDGRLIDDFSQFSRITSFTTANVEDMPMWAYYGGNHKGFCVEYDLNKSSINQGLKSCLFSVQYTNNRVDVTGAIERLVQELEISIETCKRNNVREIPINNFTTMWTSIYCNCIKGELWKHEKEIRGIVGNEERLTYVDATPSAIYIGENCETLNRDKLYKIADKFNIPIYEMVLDDKSSEYKLTIKC